MINAREIRIGNYFDVEMSKGVVENYAWVFTISQTSIRLYVPNDLEEGMFYIDSLLPIPLTEDILLKCGFECEIATKYNIRYTHANAEFGYDWNIDRGWRMRYFDRHIKCEYFHQLQNLFYALTGEELSINI